MVSPYDFNETELTSVHYAQLFLVMFNYVLSSF